LFNLCNTNNLIFNDVFYYEFKVGVFFGGLPIEKDTQTLKNNCPHIVVGTPGRILALVRAKKLSLKNVKQFILDECDKMLEALGKSILIVIIWYIVLLLFAIDYSCLFLCVFTNVNVNVPDMRRDVQEIFRNTPHEKQVMMFSATLSKEIRPVCKKFMQDVIIPKCSSTSSLILAPYKINSLCQHGSDKVFSCRFSIANGSLCGRRSEAYTPRTATALRQVEGK